MSANIGTSAFMREIVERVEEVAPASFQDRVYPVFNLDEIQHRLQSAGFPQAFVAYEGTEPADGNQGVTTSGRTYSRSNNTLLVNKRFSVMVAAEYQWTSELDDQKQEALDLLDSIRRDLQGFQGVNNKPYRFLSDGPIADSIDGVILYAQLWEITAVEQGNTT